MMLYLREDFAADWAGRDPFAEAFALQGQVYRNVKSRRTLQFQHKGRSFFAKLHGGIGWREVFKDLLQFRPPVTSAENEWLAIQRLDELGIDTMTAVAYGRRGRNPARIESFIITEDLVNTVSLEDYCATWPTKPPPFTHKQKLLRRIAEISRVLHGHGICHRDYYICHFLLQRNEAGEVEVQGEPRLFLIDLHRAMIREQLSQRWIVKDIAGLYFSAMHIGLTRRDLLRFVRLYSGKPLRAALSEDQDFWRAVQKRALAMDRKLTPGLQAAAGKA